MGFIQQLTGGVWILKVKYNLLCLAKWRWEQGADMAQYDSGKGQQNWQLRNVKKGYKRTLSNRCLTGNDMEMAEL